MSDIRQFGLWQKLLGGVSVFGMAGALLLAPAYAQAAGAADDEEIIVTARKKEERLQDVPATIAAVTADQISNAGARKLSDLSAMTSGLSYVGLGGSQTLISVRGDSNKIGSGETGTGVFIDGIFVSRGTQLGVGPVDVARVEFLKGPQSTLFGKNTIAGAINIITADPTWENYNEIEAGYGGSSENGENLWHAQFIASGPIVADKIAGRITIAHQQRDGYLYDSGTGVRGLGYDATYIRGKLLFHLADNVNWRVSASYRKDNAPRMEAAVPGSGTTVLQARPGIPAPIFPASIWESYSNFQGFARSRSASFTSDLSVETFIGTITALTNYQVNRQYFATDTDTTRYQVGASRVLDDGNTFSQELRLVGSSGRISWLGGLFYFRDDVKTTHQTVTFGPDSANYAGGVGFQDVNFPVSTTTKSVFAQIGYDVTEDFNITAGLRYSEDEKSGYVRLALLNLTGGLFREVVPATNRSATFRSTTGSITATYRLNDSALLYASYSTGNKAGGFAGVASPTTVQIPFDEAEVAATEIGIKSDWFDKRLRVNLSIFNNDYDNLQLAQAVPIAGVVQTITQNAAKARAYGADLEVRAFITPELEFNLSYTYLHARIDEYLFAPGVVLTDITPARNPDHSGVVGLTYTTALGDGELRLNGNVAFKSKYNNDIGRSAAGVVLLAPTPAYELFNAQISYAWDDYEISAYVKNITNEEYYVAQVIAIPGSFYYGSPGEPRTFEVTLKARF
ncbi:Vitamin B12 transporter BtuB [Alphaproteobacteria bacterium SO-S41]|nr:Vitamin B12 transporter BtuB [Alphaproteobacteria bacterium SO-S41]